MDEFYISDDTIRDEGDLPIGLTLETPPGPRFEALIADITDSLGATVQLEPLAEEDEREMRSIRRTRRLEYADHTKVVAARQFRGLLTSESSLLSNTSHLFQIFLLTLSFGFVLLLLLSSLSSEGWGIGGFEPDGPPSEESEHLHRLCPRGLILRVSCAAAPALEGVCGGGHVAVVQGGPAGPQRGQHHPQVHLPGQEGHPLRFLQAPLRREYPIFPLSLALSDFSARD